MPGPSFHDRQAEHNEECYRSLDRRRFPDWATTSLFYAAAHRWMAYAAEVHGKTEHRSHGDTADEMEADLRLPSRAVAAYNDLKNLSWIARYHRWQSVPSIVNVEDETYPLYLAFRQLLSEARGQE